MGATAEGRGANDCTTTTASYTGPVGGRLKHFAKTWALFCQDKWVRDTVQIGYALEFTSTPPFSSTPRPTPIPSDKQKRLALENEIQTLLQKRAIQRVQQGNTGQGFHSSFFLTPKKIPASGAPF